ncbi:unnamed protein product [Medioppia subpectinata]|uniref:Uncharacterized protein n=1 Tax=Medioppia subpectinata TaxID=1979941 RepID=A0A7R9KGE5_9ACAR|nr:unnamed protein product [Medioppia subpectinata]CAG2102867.1 unnamed protein product [Medioppia subpectinata]
MNECVVRMTQSILLGYVIDYFGGGDLIQYDHACLAAGGVCLCAMLTTVLDNDSMVRLSQLGMRARSACCTLMYKKSLKLNQLSLGKTTVGQMINLMSNDVNRFDQFAKFCNYLIIAPIQSGIIIYIMYNYMGWASFVPVALLVLLIVFQFFMSKMFSKVRLMTAKLTDTRLQHMVEIISGMRIVKMYSWEQPFADLVAEARKQEVSCIQRSCFLKAINMSQYSLIPKLMESPYPIIKNISVHLKAGDLLVVIGPVGAGKSSLLMTILKELPVLSGSIETVGSMSYAAQEAWSFNTSVQNNILFGAKYNESRYKRVVEVCALVRDFERFPFGDKSLVGERGVQLSGGQKARITLARFGRALYRNSDILLMDDPLSAVDTIQHLSCICDIMNTRCIVDYLCDKIRILVTHQIQFIRKATQILVLNDEGKCLGLGSYDELQSRGLDFMSILREADNKAEHHLEDSYDNKINAQGTLVAENLTVNVPNETNIIEPKINDEGRQTGSISGNVYCTFIKAGAGPWLYCSGYCAWIGLFFSTMVCRKTDKNQNKANIKTSEQNRDAIIYSSLMAALFVATLLRAITWFVMFMRASVNLHNTIFYRLLRAPISVFEKNPVGRILNRFSKDLGTLDEQLPTTSLDLNLSLTHGVGGMIMITIVNPYMIIPSFILIVVVLAARAVYIKQFYIYQDDHSATWMLVNTAGYAFALIIDGLCFLYTVIIFAVFMVFPEELGAGETGLALSSALMLMGLTQWGVRLSAEAESQMTSVERIIEYSKLPQEAALTAHDSHKPPPDWPQRGQIELKDVSLYYSGSDKPVLKSLNCVINASEKVGICGRTGAGKSSIISALFRMVEPKGEIVMDGINTGSIGLRDLRSAISIIPQDPVVFTGSVRKNLDPFGEYSDQYIWSALEEVQLKGPVGDLPGQLDAQLAEGGANLSVGQRQLVCLARAILRHNRVLVLDEATANVDHKTDALIQTTIRHKFSDCTVLTIAHRLNTIIDCDRVLVLDAGEIKEFGEPFVLLQQKGQLYDMCRKTGRHMFNHLLNMVKKSHVIRLNATQIDGEDIETVLRQRYSLRLNMFNNNI